MLKTNIVIAIKSRLVDQVWWRTTLIPALEIEKQVDLCAFEGSLVYRERCRTTRKVT